MPHKFPHKFSHAIYVPTSHTSSHIFSHATYVPTSHTSSHISSHMPHTYPHPTQIPTQVPTCYMRIHKISSHTSTIRHLHYPVTYVYIKLISYHISTHMQHTYLGLHKLPQRFQQFPNPIIENTVPKMQFR